MSHVQDKYLEALVRLLAMKDTETEEHTRRVAYFAVDLARVYGVPPKEQNNILRGSLLHDIGKIGIPDRVLKKKGPLNVEERKIVNLHPTLAFDLLYPLRNYRAALEIPLFHHEKWDGTGYPNGLKGTQIPLPARIFSVVDVWDALLSDRPYRTAWKLEKVQEYLLSQAGKHFDPVIVKLFLG